MRASCMSINRVDVQQAVKQVARFMAEPNEGAWIILSQEETASEQNVMNRDNTSRY